VFPDGTDEFFKGLMTPDQQKARTRAYAMYMSMRTTTTTSVNGTEDVLMLTTGETTMPPSSSSTDLVPADEKSAHLTGKTIFLTEKHTCNPECFFKPVNSIGNVEYYQRRGIIVEDLHGGHVYTCTKSGNLHTCTPDRCDSQVAIDGHVTCWKTGIVHCNSVLTPSKEFFENNQMPVSAQRTLMAAVSAEQCLTSDPLMPPVPRLRMGGGGKRKRGNEDPSAKKFEEARKIVRVLVFTIPRNAYDSDKAKHYAEIIMRVWNFSLKSPHNLERERATELQRRGGGSKKPCAVKFKRDSLTMKFSQFAFSVLYVMRFGYEIKPNFTPALLSRANGFAQFLTPEFADSHRICFLLKDNYLFQHLVAANKLPNSKSTVDGVYIDRKYINAGQQLMRVCLGSYLNKAVDDLVDTDLPPDEAIRKFEDDISEYDVPMNAT